MSVYSASSLANVAPYFSFFFLLLPRPPSSTLFPYTTLFRPLGRERLRHSGSARSEPAPDRLGLRWGRPVQDRKSTRLNSSHMSISYAVFCLKKKNVILCGCSV